MNNTKKIVRLKNEAINYNNSGNLEAAYKVYLKALKYNPEDKFLINAVGMMCLRTKRIEDGLAHLKKNQQISPNDVSVLTNLGLARILMGQLDEAVNVLERAHAIDSAYMDAITNLCGAYNSRGDHQKVLGLSLKAITLDRTHDKSYVSLGSALAGLGLSAEADIAFQTALDLNSNCLDAMLNLALSASKKDSPTAVVLLEKVLLVSENTNYERINQTKSFLSFEYLKKGNLKKGWEYYDFNFDPFLPRYAIRSPTRIFEKPRWQGQAIGSKKLLIWNEQGLGDELMFLTCLNDVIHTGASIILECDPRLVNTLARSFPSIRVRSPTYDANNSCKTLDEDFEYHIPMGSLPGFFRENIEDFKKFVPYIVVDESKNSDYSARLTGTSDKLKIGICWRSGLLTADRNSEYTSLQDWGPILSRQDCIFVNLQYGDCEAELQAAEAKFGTKIIRWADLDLKNDIDDVFALISSLDLVVTAGTAVSPMSAAVGKPTLLIQSRWGWPNLGTNYNPWFPNIYCFTAGPDQIVADCIETVGDYLTELFNITPSNG